MIVHVPLPGRAYDILIEAGVLGHAGRHLAPFARGGRLIVVADERVWALHGDTLRNALAPVEIEIVPVAQGEASKGFSTLSVVLDRLLALEVERSDTIVAFGGGVVGDLAGFAAAILKRGCGFVQVPTTLLAQVDSSVGGKTGINVAAGKNLVGAFHQPRLVLIDPEVLTTLTPRHRAAGYAEVVKYGLLGDAAFFEWCEGHGADLLAGDASALAHAIATSVAMKAAIVVEDERETADRRALLNLGHTFGHALEAETGYSDRLLHGEAVAAGMALAARYSVRRGLLDEAVASRIATHLAAVGLPTGLAGFRADGATLVAHMAHDKKKSGGTLPFVLLRGIGDAFVARDVDLADVAAFLDAEPR